MIYTDAALPTHSQAENQDFSGGKPRLGRTFGSVLSSRLGSAAVSALTIGLLARSLSPHQFGIAGSVLGTLTLAATASDLGITTRIVTLQAAMPTRALHPLVQRLLTINTILALTAALLATSILIGLSIFTRTPSFLLLLPLCGWLAADREAEFRSAVALGRLQQDLASKSILTRRVTTLSIFWGLGVTTPLPSLLSFSSASLLGSLAGWAYISNRIPLRREVVTPPEAVQEVRACLPYLWNTLGAQLRNLDVTIVSALCTPSISAIYAVPARLIAPLRIVPSSLATAILPYASSTSESRPRHLHRTLLTTLAATYTLFLILYLLAPQVLSAFAGERYAGATSSLRILLIGLVFASISSPLTSLLQGGGHTKTVARTSVLTGIFTLLLIAAMSPPYRSSGAAAAVTIGYIAQFLALALTFVLTGGKRPLGRNS